MVTYSLNFEQLYGSSGYFSHCYFFCIYKRRCNIKELQINEEIRAKEVRLIDKEGEQVGVVSIGDARNRADQANLDLVLISENAKPPVARIMDYGKYRYEAIKKAKEAKKNQKTIELKEIQLSPSIEEHDLNTKARQANKFLKEGNRVKVAVRFRGRELGRKELGKVVLDEFVELTSEYGEIDKPAKMEGRNMVMFLQQRKDLED